MGWEPVRAVDFALAAQIMSSYGIVIDRDAVDRCRTCEVTYRRRNRLRHVASKRHREAFARAWKRA